MSNSYLTFVMEQLGGVPDIATKRMFGGIGIYSAGTFFGVIDNDTLFFKVDDDLRPQYVAQGMPPFDPMPGKGAMIGYYQVPVAVLEDADDLVRWAKQSVAVGKKAPARKKRSRHQLKTPRRRRGV